MNGSRIEIFVGHFGSGKTEVAINYAIKNKHPLKKTTLVDLDIVNPYFRSSDAEELLKKSGIDLIKPVYANTNVDVPALPAEISAVIDNKEIAAVFDVGGDDLGAKALSRYKHEFEKEGYTLYVVVNVNRPMTNNIEKICEMVKNIEGNSRLKVKKIINNTNLLENTNQDDIMRSQKMIDVVLEKMSLEFGFISALGEFEEFITKSMGKPYMRLERYTGPKFL